MITRSHYQIRKNVHNWTPKEIKRWNIMKKLSCFKALISIYEKGKDLYNIYEKKINKKEAYFGFLNEDLSYKQAPTKLVMNCENAFIVSDILV